MCYVMAKRIKIAKSPSDVARVVLKGFNEMELRNYKFTLIISKPTTQENITASRLYKTSCKDALFSVSDDVYRVAFDRNAPSLEAAINSAIRNINESHIGSHVIGLQLSLTIENGKLL